MLKKKHKRKVSRIVIFTTDAADADTKQVKVSPWVLYLTTFVVCCLLGSLIGYIIYEAQIWELDRKHDNKQLEAMAALEEEKALLQAEIDTLNGEIDSLNGQIETLNTGSEALSMTILELQDQIKGLQSELDEQSMPTDYPLTGAAGIEEVTGKEPKVIFTASLGSMVISSAKGTVTAIEADENYGNKLTIDHGNGYVSVYYNGGEAQVKVGDAVEKGTTLFLIDEENKQLIYQIMKDNIYINPTEMLSING